MGTIAGTVLDMLRPSRSPKENPRRFRSQSSNTAYSSGIRTESVSRRHVAVSSSPTKVPSFTLVLPMSMARSTRSECSDLLRRAPGRLAAGVDEPRVQACIWRQLGMEGGGQQVALASGHHSPIVQGGERLGSGAHALNH